MLASVVLVKIFIEMILIEEKGRSEQGEIVAAKRQDNRVRISLSLWKDKGTTQGHLLEYLDCDLENGKSKAELAMEALSAYWLPIALKYKKVKGERLKSAGRRAIAQLAIPLAIRVSSVSSTLMVLMVMLKVVKSI